MMFEKLKPYLCVIVIQCGNAGLAIIAKDALNKGMNHYTFATYRNLIATIVIAPFALFFERTRPRLTVLTFFKIMLLGFFEPVLDQNLYYAGMKYTTVTFAAAMTNIIPAMTFLMACICRTKKFKSNKINDQILITFARLETVDIKKLHSIGKIVGTLVTVGGAMIMTLVAGPTIGLPWTKGSNDSQHQQSTTHVSHGDIMKGSIMIIFGCLSWSCFYILQVLCFLTLKTVFTRLLLLIVIAITLRSYPAGLSLTTLICAAGTLQGSIMTLIAEHNNIGVWRLHLDSKLVTIIYGGVICSGLSYYLSGIIMEAKGPVFVTAFSPLSMIIVAILGSIVLSEKLNLGRVVGAVVIVIGLYLVIWGKARDEVPSNSNHDENPPVDQPIHVANDRVAIEMPSTVLP
ncbi:WAT1-related protein At2g39510-like [Bidens hawaiensis]|uniref:WAT1-related protein At2g39510-like n=1 Tax=Bidens hawaiensis TaxID=980011 RepID=UPI00404A4A01